MKAQAWIDPPSSPVPFLQPTWPSVYPSRKKLRGGQYTMRFFATNKCRAVILCGALFACGGATQNLKAREAQAQGSSQSDIALFDAFLDAHADIDAQLRAN